MHIIVIIVKTELLFSFNFCGILHEFIFELFKQLFQVLNESLYYPQLGLVENRPHIHYRGFQCCPL